MTTVVIKCLHFPTNVWCVDGNITSKWQGDVVQKKQKTRIRAGLEQQQVENQE